MIHPIPPGTRDILPDEMGELRQLEQKLLEAFTGFGYGEVGTPTIEYDEVLARGDGRTAGSAYRFFDERGDLLALRSDMTVPIARLVAGRYAADRPIQILQCIDRHNHSPDRIFIGPRPMDCPPQSYRRIMRIYGSSVGLANVI